MDIVQDRGAGLFVPKSPHSQATEAWGVGRLFAATTALLGRWQGRAKARRELARLDARLLADVGLDPDAVRFEIGRPFWKGYVIAELAAGERSRQARSAAALLARNASESSPHRP